MAAGCDRFVFLRVAAYGKVSRVVRILNNLLSKLIFNIEAYASHSF